MIIMSNIPTLANAYKHFPTNVVVVVAIQIKQISWKGCTMGARLHINNNVPNQPSQ